MTPAERLAALRAALRQAGVEGFLIPRADEHLGEYVPPSGERLAWLSGFTGSAGLAVVLDDRAALFTDGRYTTQAQQQLDPALWELRHITEQPAVDWLKEHAAGRRVGYDPWLHPEAALEAAGSRRGSPWCRCRPTRWTRSGLTGPRRRWPQAVPHPLDHAGPRRRTSARRRQRRCARRARMLRCWPTATRSPGCSTFAAATSRIRRSRSALACCAPMPRPSSSWIPARSRPRPARISATRSRSAARGAAGGAAGVWPGKPCGWMPRRRPAWFAETLRAAGATIAAGDDPVRLPRACKNPVEQAGRTRRASARCGGAGPLPRLVCRHRAGRAADRGECRRAAAGLPPGGAAVPGRELPRHQRRRGAWRRHPLPRDGGERPADPRRRMLPDRQRRAVPRRHHRRHPHPLDRARPGPGRAAGALHARAAGACRPGDAALPEGRGRAAPGCLRPAGAVGGRARLRPRHRPRRRQLPVRA